MRRILHIEDDPANRLLVRKLLQNAGFEVIDAADGLEGVRLACSIKPDLVLVDLNVPGLDGFEVTLRLRGEPELRGVPIVAITAEGDRETSLAVGCDGFLQKPIDARVFASVIQRYLGGAREVPPAAQSARLREQSQRIVAHLEEKVAELSRANEQLVDLAAARSAFYRNTSHELATPMTPIVGYVKLLADEELGPLNKAQQKALRSVDECVGRLRRLIDDLLDVTGLETGRMHFDGADYDLGEAVRRALAQVTPALHRAGMTSCDEVPQGELTAHGDADRIVRATLHLLENALKFASEGRFVGVRARRTESGFEVCVADDGPGIPAERALRIFDPFYQVDGSMTRLHGGVGVGLAIARRTAMATGGELRVVSPSLETIGGRVFRGAAFILTLPERLRPEAP